MFIVTFVSVENDPGASFIVALTIHQLIQLYEIRSSDGAVSIDEICE